MGIKVITKNKRAGFDFFLQEKFEAGLVLQGTEIKVLRLGKVNINDSYITVDSKGEAWAYNILIPQYEFGNIYNHREDRPRKLLLHKEEIANIFFQAKAKNLTVIATMIYFKGSRVKLEIALAKGKKLHDKRDTEAKRDVERKIQKGNYDF